MAAGLFSLANCRQTDELETSTNAVNSNSIYMKGTGIINTTTSTNDSLVVSNLSVVDDKVPPVKETDNW